MKYMYRQLTCTYTGELNTSASTCKMDLFTEAPPVARIFVFLSKIGGSFYQTTALKYPCLTKSEPKVLGIRPLRDKLPFDNGPYLHFQASELVDGPGLVISVVASQKREDLLSVKEQS